MKILQQYIMIIVFWAALKLQHIKDEINFWKRWNHWIENSNIWVLIWVWMYLATCALINWSMTCEWCSLIVVRCDTFTAGLWYLAGCCLTGTWRRTPWRVVKFVGSSLDLLDSTSIVLKFTGYLWLEFADLIIINMCISEVFK